MQDEWLEKKDVEIETYAATKNPRMFFSAIKEVYGPTKPRSIPLLPADDSTLHKEKSSINSRWREHFSTLLHRPSTLDPTVLDQIPQKPLITSLDLPPTIDEVSKGIRQTSSGKSPGMDGIPAEIFKSATHALPCIFRLLAARPGKGRRHLFTARWSVDLIGACLHCTHATAALFQSVLSCYASRCQPQAGS